MMLTKEQLSELICKHSERENGLQDMLEILLESMMLSERREYLRENSASGNKCNGFRPGHSYGHGRTLTFRIPRDRYGNFHPRILAILRHQEDECERLAGTLYTKGLTQEQVGEVFQDIYGEHYSKASISRMLDYLREDVSQWLTRSLEAYYPIVFIDCVHMKIHRKRSVEIEAFYVVLAVREDKRREVLGIFNKPTERVVFQKVCLGRRLQILQICKYSDSCFQIHTPRRVALKISISLLVYLNTLFQTHFLGTLPELMLVLTTIHQ